MLEDPAAELREEDKDSVVTKVKDTFTFNELIKELEDVEPEKELVATKEEIIVKVADLVEESRTVEPADKIKKALIENMENHIKSTEAVMLYGSNGSAIPNLLRQTAEHMIDNMAVRHFVGVQPMTGPIGLVYVLQYKTEEVNTIDEDKETRLSLEVVSKTLEAGARKLEYDLTIEAMQDVEARNPMADDDIDPARDMSKEIYEEVRNDISAIARKETLDMGKVKGDATYFDQNKVMLIATKINYCANEIACRTRRGAGNFVIVSETVAEILKHSSFFSVNLPNLNRDYGYIRYIGTLSSGIDIYSDKSIEHNKIIIGYKGHNGEIDTGYIYAPYVMLMSTGVVIDPMTFQPLIKFMTRYGKLVIRNEEVNTTEDGSSTTITREPSNYYIEMTIDNLPKLHELEFKKEKEKKETDVIDTVTDTFKAAMELLD